MDLERPQARSLDDPDERRQRPGAERDLVRLGDLFALHATGTRHIYRLETAPEPVR